MLQIKKLNPEVHLGCLRINYSDCGNKHWDNKESALKDFEQLINKQDKTANITPDSETKNRSLEINKK